MAPPSPTLSVQRIFADVPSTNAGNGLKKVGRRHRNVRHKCVRALRLNYSAGARIT